MGIGTNQFDFIDARFRSHRIKVLDVVCCEAGQAVEIVTADAAVADELRDPTTGDVILGRVLRASITDATASIVNNKVNNRFIVTVQVFDVSSGVPVPIDGATQTGIEVDDFTVCAGIRSGDIIQKHDIQPEVSFSVSTIDPFDVTMSVDVDYCLIVSRETILKVSAAEPFCC